jgi:hypothetical protein
VSQCRGDAIRKSNTPQLFKRNDLGLQPIHHQLEHRIEAHIFVAFEVTVDLSTLPSDFRTGRQDDGSVYLILFLAEIPANQPFDGRDELQIKTLSKGRGLPVNLYNKNAFRMQLRKAFINQLSPAQVADLSSAFADLSFALAG